MATLPPPARRASQLWQGRVLSVLAVVLLVAFSPRVGTWLSERFSGSISQQRRLPAPVLPTPPAPSAALLADYAQQVPGYLAAINRQQPSPQRRVKLLEAHFLLYRQARMVLGVAQADALLHLLTVETRNQDPSLPRASVYASPEAALIDARSWLGAIEQVAQNPALPGARIEALAPARMAPGVVRRNARWIVRAANRTHVPPAVLAAIVDNEQAGSQVAYGLAGYLRDLTDTLALRNAQTYGSSGLVGRLSQTVGLTQMSWQDALQQQSRLTAFDAQPGVPFPQTEAEVRDLLQRPYANLLFAGSRLAGYLNFADRLGTNSAVAHADAWVYALGPGWHNNPALMSSGQMWPYAWNGFFKACLYQRLLAR